MTDVFPGTLRTRAWSGLRVFQEVRGPGQKCLQLANFSQVLRATNRPLAMRNAHFIRGTENSTDPLAFSGEAHFTHAPAFKFNSTWPGGRLRGRRAGRRGRWHRRGAGAAHGDTVRPAV